MEKKTLCPCCGADMTPRHCLSCGGPLVIKPAPTQKSYCNSTCRMAAMRKRDRARLEKWKEAGGDAE
jgi:hypothetical protein